MTSKTLLRVGVPLAAAAAIAATVFTMVSAQDVPEWIDQGDGGETADTDGNGDTDPIETTLEWGVRSLGKRVAVKAEGDLPTEAVADLFPAYDDDGGLLLVLTPE